MSYASAVIAAPPRRVWEIVRRFDGMADWHPGIAKASMDGDRDPSAVGATRTQVLADGNVVRARLAALDEGARSITYEIVDGHFPVDNYRSTIRVLPVTETGEAFVEWWGTFDAHDPAQLPELERTFGHGVYETGLQALRAASSRPG